jgi:single-strand DNA-binding protein
VSLPILTGTGRVITDPELRYAASGGAVVRVRLAFNSRKKDPNTGEWVDDSTFFVRGTAFGQLAESIAESLTKGLEVVVTGRMKTEQWEKNGEKQEGTSLLIDSIGPSLRYATAKVTKASGNRSGQPGNGGQSSGGWGGQSPTADPWATQGASHSDRPPF